MTRTIMLDKKEYSNYGKKILKMKLYLDDSFYFIVSVREVSGMSVEIINSIPFDQIINALSDTEIKENVFFEFEEADNFLDELKMYLYKKLIKKGYALLEVKDYSEKEIVDKFEEITNEENIVNSAIDYFKKMHAIDDERVIESYIDFHKNTKSINEMRYKLSSKGFDKDLIERIIEEKTENAEEKIIKEFIEKKQLIISELGYEERQKLTAKFLRKGFSYETINKVFKSL